MRWSGVWAEGPEDPGLSPPSSPHSCAVGLLSRRSLLFKMGINITELGGRLGSRHPEICETMGRSWRWQLVPFPWGRPRRGRSGCALSLSFGGPGLGVDCRWDRFLWPQGALLNDGSRSSFSQGDGLAAALAPVPSGINVRCPVLGGALQWP